MKRSTDRILVTHVGSLVRPQILRDLVDTLFAEEVFAEADTELFTDVYSMERDVEPRAAAPIRALFQETALEEERQ